MTVDFKNDAHVLTVHGVQIGEDKDIKSDQQIRKLVTNSLARSHLERDFVVEGCFYEDLNDKAQTLFSLLAKAIAVGKPLLGTSLKQAIDLIGDVVIAARNTSTAGKIREKLRHQILETYQNGHQLVVVSHSLGTVYALDVINSLIADTSYFDGDDKRTWPVQGLITMGSPLGLDIELPDMKVFEKRGIETISSDWQVLPWHNYFNRLDPVVSGSVFGRPIELKGSKGPVELRYGDDTRQANWMLQGHRVTSGKQWLLAHTTYWRNPKIGDRLVDLLWG